MKRCPGVVAAVLALGLAGCGNLGPQSASGSPVDRPAAVPQTTEASATSGFGSVKDSGDIPDPCTLLSEKEVVDLTGRAITQIDRDGAKPGESTRYCQWQQDGGQLAIFLSRTTSHDFQSQIDGAEPVDGVGEDAFSLAGHLYVLYGTVQLDVYSHGGDEDQNLEVEKKVAGVLLDRV